jgi:hypothetical protein
MDGEEIESLYTGTESSITLGNLFAMWVQDRGDLSNWTDAGQFGETVAKYSDLTPCITAVWLGLDPHTFSEPQTPEQRLSPIKRALSWHFNDPDGHPMTLERIISA